MCYVFFLLYFLKLLIAQMVSKEVIVKTDVRFHALDTGVSKCANVPGNIAISSPVANLNK